MQVSAWFTKGALQELGGSTLVVKPVGSAWRVGPLGNEQIRVLADTWNAAGEAALEHGVRLAVHLDFLSALRLRDGLERLLEATDPALVGVGARHRRVRDLRSRPVRTFYRRLSDRVWHLQLKGARDRVSDRRP